jgi:RHS repeat-associated protein
MYHSSLVLALLHVVVIASLVFAPLNLLPASSSIAAEPSTQAPRTSATLRAAFDDWWPALISQARNLADSMRWPLAFSWPSSDSNAHTSVPAHDFSASLLTVHVSEDIISNTTWTAANSPYILDNDVTVASGVTLTVEPGVMVMGGYGDELRVAGHLDAVGTASQPITFTSAIDSGPYQWSGLVFDGGTGHLRHVTARYGGYSSSLKPSNIAIQNVISGEVRIESSRVMSATNSGDDYGVYISNSRVVVSDTLFAGNGDNLSDPDYGLYATGSSTILTVTDSVFQGNAGWAMGLDADHLHHVWMTGNSFGGNEHDRVRVDGGTLNGDATLFAQASAARYELDGDVTAPVTTTLTVEPGVMVMGGYGDELRVAGHLDAVGTASQPITFTSAIDSGPYQWSGLVFDGGVGELEYAIVRYAETGVTASDGQIDLHYATITRNYRNGIHLSGTAPVFTATGCTISDNGSSYYGLLNETGTQVDARYNSWGHVSGPYHPTLNPDGLGDRVSDDVLFEPWLEQVVSLATESLREGETTVVGETTLSGATVDIRDLTADVLLGTGTAGTGGSFSIVVSPPLIYGHTIVAVADGLQSLAYQVGRAVTIDAPASPLTGTVYFEGLAPALSTLELYADEAPTPIVTTTVGADSHWSAVATLSCGSHTVAAKAVEPDKVSDPLVIDVIAPRIVGHTPSSTVVGTLQSVQFSFSHPMDPTSFSLSEDIRSFSGPTGPLTATGYTWIDAYTLEVTFDPQTTSGVYELVIGPQITCQAGSAMDQDGDCVLGESLDDRYAATFLLSLSGTIDEDTTLHPSTQPIILDGSLVVASGVTLTIEAGTIVKFSSSAVLDIRGNLDVLGTPADPVVLTSWRDDTVGGDTNGDGSSSSPAVSDWQGVRFNSATVTGTLNNVEIRYAEKAIYGSVSGASVELHNAVLRNNEFGVYVYTPYVEIEAENCLIVDNAYTGIFVRADSREVFRNCTVVGNGFQGSGWYGAGVHLGGANLTLDNVIVALNADGLHHSGDPPALAVRHSDFYNPDGDEVIWDGDPGEPQLDQDGNTTADPLFVDSAAGDYELAASSPAVDAGRGIHAPSEDILGRPRHDDLGMPNQGTGFPIYVDMGAYERQENTGAADLRVMYVADPAPVLVGAGDSFVVEWKVMNGGLLDGDGTWQDKVYLSPDPYPSGDDPVLATRSYSGTFTSGDSYRETLTATAPITVGLWYVLVHTNASHTITEAVNSNNVGVASGVLAVDMPLLELDTPLAGTVSPGQWSYYRFEGSPGRTVRFDLDVTAATGAVGLYIRYGLPPTLSAYDAVGYVSGQVDQATKLLEPLDGTYYVGVYGVRLPGGTSSHTLSATLTNLDVDSVSPTQVGNGGQATFKIGGDAFESDTQVQLVAPDSTVIEGAEWYQDSSTLFATFDLAGASAAPGLYDVVVTLADSTSATEFNAVTIEAGGAAALQADLTVPGLARPGRTIEVRVEYANTGNVDLPSPLLTIVSKEDASWNFDTTGSSDDGWITGEAVSLLALSSDGPAAILRPGQSESVAIRVRTPFSPGDMPFTLYSFGTPGDLGLDDPIDWEQMGQDLRPPDASDDAWDPLFERLKAQVGTTWGDYLTVLRDNADHLAELGQRVHDSAQLFTFEFVQAAQLGSPPSLTSVDDAGCPAPGLPLVFARSFLAGPSYRAREGALGRGWTHSYEITLHERPDGSVVVNGPDGFDRIFDPDGIGGYTGAPGDYATLTAETGDQFLLAEKYGLSTHFRPDGRFDYIEEPNGNRVTATYNASGELTRVRHSNGDEFTFTYYASGRLATLIDHDGRVTNYAYDGSGEHLLTVTRPDGEAMTYTYTSATGALKSHCLTSIAAPDAPVVHFEYDGLGRLSEQYLGSGEEQTQFSYSTAGKTFISDALDNTTILWMDGRGRTARVENSLGAAMDMAYDANWNLVEVAGPTGLTSGFAYDDLGNLTSTQDPMGHVTEFEYGGAYSNLLWARDARGNTTHYAYDITGNLTGITYADGTAESYAYDAFGNASGWMNRRGDAISYTYNDRGQLTQVTYPGGISSTYTYDGAGRLIATADDNGTTTLEYDTDNDWLTKITYPEGRYLEFDYNDAGQRVQMVDQAGFAVDYEYDAAGRLSRLTGGSGSVVISYTYNLAGHLTREYKGNGTYTTYEYDAAGQVLHLVNYGPDDSVQSRFDYTYDALGRRTEMDTLDGAWTYTYDDSGQLVHAVFDSTNPSVDDQDLTYEYDAVGNRIRTIFNGVTTAYTTNDMNQYTQVGDATYAYDADGNMVLENSTGEMITYAYDYDNRLIGVTSSVSGTWAYTYDALGNRVGSVHDGNTTRYFNDPTGLVDVVGEYSGGGALVARYVHGLGLVSRVDAVGNPAYYAFDAIGNTRQMSNMAGAVVNAYDYTPFGTVIQQVETIPNPFRYVGQLGVMGGENSLQFMRARFYDPDLGRFISADPLRIPSYNAYSYAYNEPTKFSDAIGLWSISWSWHDFLDALSTYSGVMAATCTAAAIGSSPLLLSGAGSLVPGSFAFGALVFTGISVVAQGIDIVFFSDQPVHDWVIAYADLIIPWPVEWMNWIPTLSWGTIEDIYWFLSEKLLGLPQGSVQSEQTSSIRTSHTPEDKFGPTGYDPPGTPEGSEVRYVAAGQTFHYRVEFWNKEDAPVPTQDAIIEDVLDPNVFDLDTFEFTHIGFLKWDVPLPGGQAIDTRIDLRPEMDLAVGVTASFDHETGKISWWFHCVDPLTGDYPADPMAGFLPPYNPDTGFEIGWVEFSVEPKAGLSSGTTITNQAFVEFDFAGDLYNHPAPKEGPWINTIDAGVPESQVNALPATSGTNFQVLWSGTDDANGSGIASYDIYVSTDGGAYVVWLEDTTETSAVFSGEGGHTYAFYSVARDGVGHEEAAPTSPDAQTEAMCEVFLPLVVRVYP